MYVFVLIYILRNLLQAFIRILEAAILFLSTPKGEPLNRFCVSSSIISYVSLLIGELGRKRSRSALLKLYLFGSSIATVISVAFLIKSEKLFELMEDLSKWESSAIKIFKFAAVLLGVVVQIFTIVVTSSLVSNMAPPKRAS
ncbi:uncharacterized protein LOC111381816 [Olea europaea var. sylvestris]|uniref:uncharacterized protein LOC111381816 n=1 Tax=Olea europaea var. sylvestris TaxID=158386 RepID=UPI000C1D5011|nr:uncharacterized protein LOC111381816 [Olea europaea var. sylvestris]